MKILHLSDTHLIGDDEPSLYGIDPALRLKRAFSSMQKYHSDVSFLVITGDLSDDGSIASYKKLHNIIQDSNLDTYLILGNHDKRDNFRAYFPEFFTDGFVQYDKKFDNKVFLFLDTLVESYPYGTLCDKRMEWLSDRLKEYKDREIYLFMHHHPIDSGLYEMDNIANFKTSDEFWKLLEGYQNVRHIAFGHLHRIFHGIKNGVSFHSTRSSTFQVSLKQRDMEELLTNSENPTYSVINIDKYLSIHHHEYMDEEIVYKGYC